MPLVYFGAGWFIGIELASLLTGILLGDDSGLPQAVQDDFRRTGTTHIIPISGYIQPQN